VTGGKNETEMKNEQGNLKFEFSLSVTGFRKEFNLSEGAIRVLLNAKTKKRFFVVDDVKDDEGKNFTGAVGKETKLDAKDLMFSHVIGDDGAFWLLHEKGEGAQELLRI
jgi:hypothetical protein